MVKGDSKTNATFVSLFKPFLRRVKFESLWISWHFWGLFNYAHLPPTGDAPILSQVKGLMEIHNCGNFNEYNICGCEVMNLQIFSDQQKIPFLGAFGWFFGHNSRECSQILFRFETIMKTNTLHHIYHGFWHST